MVRTVLLLLMLFTSSAYADFNLKLRAREHFVDRHLIELPDGSTTKYSGASNTVNIWHEEVFNYSIGLSLSPILGSPDAVDSNNAPLGREIQLQVYGLEGKYYPINDFKGFIRLGYGYTRLKGKAANSTFEGSSYYAGLGWEFPVWKIHLAPEYAIRKSQLQQGVTIDSQVISVGFHFYEHF